MAYAVSTSGKVSEADSIAQFYFSSQLKVKNRLKDSYYLKKLISWDTLITKLRYHSVVKFGLMFRMIFTYH